MVLGGAVIFVIVWFQNTIAQASYNLEQYTSTKPVLIFDGNPNDEEYFRVNKDMQNNPYLRLENTSISCEIIKTKEPLYYLNHTKSGKLHYAGWPFIDLTFPKNSFVTTIYGHSVYGTHLAFSDLKFAYESDVFNSLTNGIYFDGNTLKTARKLCAVKISEHDVHLVEPNIHSRDQLADFLFALAKSDGSFIENYKNTVSRVSEILLLVTCSDIALEQPYRTVSVFSLESKGNNNTLIE